MRKITKKLKKKMVVGVVIAFGLLAAFTVAGVYAPKSFGWSKTISYNAEQGMGDDEIAKELKEQGIIANTFFFKLYVLISGSHAKLQAGLYDISPSMSVAAIVNKIAKGDVVKNKITVLEGWDADEISSYLEKKKFYTSDDFSAAISKDYNSKFTFLKGRPKGVGLEGFLFPDTYSVPAITSPDKFVETMLQNFDRKLTPTMRTQITKDKRTIYQVVIMASILEKEVRTLEDKKIVAGILWKRLANGMPLQLDSTVNYITSKSDVRVAIKDTKIDSPYNTYKYTGLPLGPISNPGLDSLLAAVYPTKSPYWFYLSASKTGKTIFSNTFRDHSLAITKYLN